MAVWDRQPGESPQAFSAFALYRDMGVSRSSAKVGQEFGKSKRLMDRWSSRWGWVRRVDQWDAIQDQQHREEQEEERREMLRRHANIGVNMLNQVAARLRALARVGHLDRLAHVPGLLGRPGLSWLPPA